MIDAMEREAKGIPIGRAAEVNLRNNHSQYIFTWYVLPVLARLTPALVFRLVAHKDRYGLSLATSIMLWMIIRKRPSSEGTRRVRSNIHW